MLIVALIYIKIPVDSAYIIFAFSGLLYLVFWFALCRWIIGFQKTSSWNALALVIFWVGMNFMVPMTGNMLIQKLIPVKEGLQAQIEQREGYHNKWDEAKVPTMQKFHKIYPQFRQYNIAENSSFSYTWYYAMQHMADVESEQSAKQYHKKMLRRNNAAVYLGYLLPNIQTQLVQSEASKSGMENQLNYAEGLKKFHEKQRLYFYPSIFKNVNGNTIDWTKQTVKTFADSGKVNLLGVFLPYFIIISFLLILSQIKFRKLC